MYERKAACDVTIQTMEEDLRCHGVVLTASSSDLNQKLKETDLESITPKNYDLSEFHRTHVSEVLNFLYTGKYLATIKSVIVNSVFGSYTYIDPHSNGLTNIFSLTIIRSYCYERQCVEQIDPLAIHNPII